MMIPSENYTYPEVLSAVGSVLMHKYSEGQPGKRYYQGNKYIDEIETLCQKRALAAFNLNPKTWGVNVQAHSGSEANLAVINGLLKPKEKILSMTLSHGGHLSHGWHLPDKKVTLVSKVWNVDFYGVNKKTKVFDYDEIEKIALRFKPKLIISGGTAYPREINHQKLAAIAKKVHAYYLADISHEAGLVAGGANSSPFPFADIVTMTTHKTLRGPRGALIFGKNNLMAAINHSVFPEIQGGPHNHTIAGIAVALAKTKTKKFKQYAWQTVKNAKYLATLLKKFNFDIVSGGTDKHLILIDLRNKNTNGWFAAYALEAAGIVTNRNSVPYDKDSIYYPSGLRLGTPAITVRGMKEREMEKIANWINKVISWVGERKIPANREERKKYLDRFKKEVEKSEVLKKINKEVKNLCKRFQIPK